MDESKTLFPPISPTALQRRRVGRLDAGSQFALAGSILALTGALLLAMLLPGVAALLSRLACRLVLVITGGAALLLALVAVSVAVPEWTKRGREVAPPKSCHYTARDGCRQVAYTCLLVFFPLQVGLAGYMQGLTAQPWRTPPAWLLAAPGSGGGLVGGLAALALLLLGLHRYLRWRVVVAEAVAHLSTLAERPPEIQARVWEMLGQGVIRPRRVFPYCGDNPALLALHWTLYLLDDHDRLRAEVRYVVRLLRRGQDPLARALLLPSRRLTRTG